MEEVLESNQSGISSEDSEQPMISLPEIILLNLYIIPLDLVGLVLVFFALDDFGIIDLLTFPVTQFYFRIKGAQATVDLVASIIELIPYVGALPIKTVGLNMSIYFTNHPPKVIDKLAVAKLSSMKK
ncbi:hypothetical protein COV23_00365 [Candidatus Wolfebacteria bacterium CG10_big_fil_rev_8_21_14_0_10_31_9]|uniref:Uncharacterized protein n=1 Tax=Candidatus Wolfebacteria bacterium CG10_big_fil_rev_8_21_14_0_10_31_9 TaxID=1975070 RepID=A0A2H0RCQ6_9BACT|nr:MAG: hypothetical protein COV23_00365 [Candidatus Wolfebacteria bacterium CG10_big_fil_rev_8_21_14_0_10_31_9]